MMLTNYVAEKKDTLNILTLSISTYCASSDCPSHSPFPHPFRMVGDQVDCTGSSS